VDNPCTVELGKQILAGPHQQLLDQVLPFALFVHDHRGRFRVVNNKACQSVGYSRDELLRMNVTDLEQDFDLPSAQAEWGKLVPGRSLELFGHQRRKDGSIFPVHVHFSLLEADGERIYFGCVNDISERRSADEPSPVVTTLVNVAEQRRLSEVLRVAQADLKALLDNVPARITAWNADYTNRFINLQAERDFGMPASMAVGKPVWEIIGTDRFGRAKAYIDAALAGNAQSHEQVDTQPDGKARYSHVSYIPKRRGDTIVGLYSLAIDVTELRGTYEKIRALAQRLEQVREQERRSISQILHEGLAQDLFAMKLGIEHLQAQVVGRAGVTKAFEEISEAATKCIADSRQIANDLRPTALAHLRVAVAIEEHARFFGELANLKVQVREWSPFPELGETVRLLLFRATQEALTNVARHAKASRVDVNLRADDRHIVLEVTGDGIGIAGADIEKPGSLGIMGLRERVQAFGGGLSVSKRTGSGTVFSLQIPISSVSRLS
jgi:PAS domain S-box-containing protein